MTNQIRITLLSAALAGLLLPAAAQNSGATGQPNPSGAAPTPSATSGGAPPPSGGTPTPSSVVKPPAESIAQHKENQQDRIANGINNGNLTAGEATKLEKQESNLNQEERDMRKLDNGHLTNTDRKDLRQQQNTLSNEIYQDKHNAAKQNTSPTSEVGQRTERQQDRIGQGVNSGQLTAGEAANLEKRESGINKEIATDRKANGGHLTAQQRAQVNRQQNRVSKQIHKDKHNGRRQ